MTTTDWRESQKPFDKEIQEASRMHALEVFPQESVGLVADNMYVPIENKHDDPDNHFKVDGAILAAYGKDLQGVIHSHNLDLHPAHPSRADMEAQLAWDIPFGIQLVNQNGAGNIVWWGDSLPVAHYEARPYIFGVYDCFSVWRDYYRAELGIEIPNFAREDDFWENGEDIYRDNTAKAGFDQVDFSDLQANDIILLKIRSKEIPNHGILYLGGDEGLHHPPFKASCRETVSRWIDPNKELFDSVWRYKK